MDFKTPGNVNHFEGTWRKQNRRRWSYWWIGGKRYFPCRSSLVRLDVNIGVMARGIVKQCAVHGHRIVRHSRGQKPCLVICLCQWHKRGHILNRAPRHGSFEPGNAGARRRAKHMCRTPLVRRGSANAWDRLEPNRLQPAEYLLKSIYCSLGADIEAFRYGTHRCSRDAVWRRSGAAMIEYWRFNIRIRELMRPSDALKAHRTELRQLASRFGVLRPRVFGSVVTGADSEESDLDLLVDPVSTTTLLTLARLQNEAEALLGVAVDVQTPGSLSRRFRDRVLEQAVPV